jgi:hypothetical protein
MRRPGTTALVLALSTSGCGTILLPHRIQERDVTAVETVTLTNLPAGSRVVLEEGGGHRRVLANDVEGQLRLPLTFTRHEHVDNGKATVTGGSRAIDIAIHASGYMPRIVHFNVPATTVVDAGLRRPPLVPLYVTGPALPEWDRATDLRLSGRCAESSTHAEKAKALGLGSQAVSFLEHRMRECSEALPVTSASKAPDSASVVEEPSALLESPALAIAALRDRMVAEKDEIGSEGLAALVKAVRAGELDKAARLARLVAAPEPVKRAALILRLPTLLLAEARMNRAFAQVDRGELREAMKTAAEARHIDPLVLPRRYDGVRHARVEELRAKAKQEEAAAHPVVARAYWFALASMEGSTPDVVGGLARTERATLDAFRLRFAIVAASRPDLEPRLRERLASMLPAYVTMVSASDDPDAVLTYAVGDPARKYRVSRSTRSKAVVIGTVARRNPDYRLAQEEVQQAHERVEEARANYEQFHAQAQQNAAQAAASSGAFSGAFAGLAAAGEGTGVAIFEQAKSDFEQARRKLASTRRTIREAVTRSATYPVVVFEAASTSRVLLRVDGFAEPIADQGEASTRASAVHIEGDPSIDVDPEDGDTSAFARLSPDVTGALLEAAGRLAARLRASEADCAWWAFESNRSNQDMEAAVASAVGVLLATADDDTRRAKAIQFLTTELP